MTVFRRYVGRRFAAYFALMLTALAALALALDLMEEADRVLASAYGGLPGLLWYSLLRLPDITAQMLPIATLLGALTMLAQLMRHSELVAMWGSGVSSLQLMRMLLPVAAGLGLLGLLNADIAVPHSRAELRAWGVGEARKSGFVADDGVMTWLRSGTDIIRTPKRASPTGELHDVTIFRRDAAGGLLERIDAGTAAPQEDGWLLTDVRRTPVGTAEIQLLDSLRWNGRIDVAALPLIASEFRDLRSGEILGLVEHEGFGQRPTDRYRTWLQARASTVIIPALMIFLAVSLAQQFRRTGAFAALLFTSLGIGFAFFALDGITLALGEVGLLPSWVAAWSAKLALVCLIGTFVVDREG